MTSVESADSVCHKLMSDLLWFSIVLWLVSFTSLENPEPTVDHMMSTDILFSRPCTSGSWVKEAGCW